MDIATDTNLAATQIVLTLDDDDVQESTDITRRRMNKLRTITQTADKNGCINLKNVNGAFVCVNPSCPSVKVDQSTHARDTLSAVAIDLSGIATLLLGITFPQFNRNISPSQTDQFNQLAAAFCTGNAVKPITAGNNT
ncbi:hypothetical protein AB4K20DRAFT_1948104 [Rhizopus microsporus]